MYHCLSMSWVCHHFQKEVCVYGVRMSATRTYQVGVLCGPEGGWVRRRSRPTGAPSAEGGTAQRTAASSLPQPGP